jgi:hypothetical protein
MDMTVELSPSLANQLRRIGRMFAFQNTGELLKTQPPYYTVSALSDYGGELGEPYETFATYLVHWNATTPLLNLLAKLRADRKFPSRRVQYKTRKKFHPDVPGMWIEAFAHHPGLLLVMCWSRQLSALPQFRQAATDFRKALETSNSSLNDKVAVALVRKIAFLAVVGHLLQERDRFVWISDHDKVLDGASGLHLPDALQHLMNTAIGHRLAIDPTYTPGPLDDDHEILLSIADLAAGTFASHLPAPFSSEQQQRVSVTDPVVNDMLRSFGVFGSPFEQGGPPAKSQ